MEDREYLIILYDYYGELLNDMQRDYFEQYYFDNLSLAEISENDGKSRNAIHKCIKSSSLKLYEYEDKLKLYEKRKKLDEIIDKIDNDEIKECSYSGQRIKRGLYKNKSNVLINADINGALNIYKKYVLKCNSTNNKIDYLMSRGLTIPNRILVKL